MADAKEWSEWNRATSIIVRAHNVHASKKSEMLKFQDIHPYFAAQQVAKRKQGPTKEQLALLKREIESM